VNIRTCSDDEDRPHGQIGCACWLVRWEAASARQRLLGAASPSSFTSVARCDPRSVSSRRSRGTGILLDHGLVRASGSRCRGARRRGCSVAPSAPSSASIFLGRPEIHVLAAALGAEAHSKRSAQLSSRRRAACEAHTDPSRTPQRLPAQDRPPHPRSPAPRYVPAHLPVRP
jgi:hypothetical protein